MVYVLVTVNIKPGLLAQALAIYRDLVPQVLAGEPGCLEYVPTIDLASGLPTQMIDENRISVRERWVTLEDFKAHVDMPHTCEFRSRLKEVLAAPVSVMVTRDAL